MAINEQNLSIPAIHARQSVLTITFRVIVLELIYLAGVIVVLLLINMIFLDNDWAYLISTLCVFALIKITSYIWISGRWMNIYYLIYSEHIVRHSGLFNHQEKTYLLDQAGSVDVVQSFWGGLFNYGTLVVRDKKGGELFRLPDIHEAKRYKELITISISNVTGRAVPVEV